MRIVLHNKFIKSYKKLSPNIRAKFKKQRDLFILNPLHPLLNNHKLGGELEGYRSINITGDIRLIYKQLESDTVIFVEIGSHSQLYG